MANFYSQASNFNSMVEGGVDPRTGSFNVNMPLAHLVGNRNLGPSLALTLNYSQLSSTNQGFGYGVSLGFSNYDTETGFLQLSTGERYRVRPQMEEHNGRLSLEQHLLDTVHFEMHDKIYKIVYKSGLVEWLTSSEHSSVVKVPEKICTPAGHYLEIKWDYSTGNHFPRLLKIIDQSNVELLKVDYSRYPILTELEIWPDKVGDAYKLTLEFKLSDHLTKLKHHGLKPKSDLEWTFEYEEDRNLLREIHTPTGLIERIEYCSSEEGHQFPESAHLLRIPYVTMHTKIPGQRQPKIETSYTYSKQNYLGYDGNSTETWGANADYLYSVLSSYSYHSQATTEAEVATDNGNTEMHSSIKEFHYNNFHLLTKEIIWEGDCKCITDTVYYAKIGAALVDQTPQFQLPKTVTVTYQQGAGDQRKTRSEITKTNFDDSGNMIRQEAPDGIITTWTYYPAQGKEGGAPAEPNGFVRLLEKEESLPENDTSGSLKQSKIYTYEKLLAEDKKMLAVVLKSTTELNGGAKLREVINHYDVNQKSPEFGRIINITNNIFSDNISYKTTQAFTFSYSGNELTQTLTTTTHDNLTITATQRQSCWSGRILSTSDTQGNDTHYTYDGLGRILTKTYLPMDQKYRNQTVYTYSLTDQDGTRPSTKITDHEGNWTCTWFDGLGRMIRKACSDPLSPSDATVNFFIETRTYDGRGRLASITTQDRLPPSKPDQEPQITTTTKTFIYDQWDQVIQTNHSKGYEERTVYDPIARRKRIQLKSTTKHGGQQKKLSKQVTHYNVQNLPEKISYHDNENKEIASTRATYNALGQLLTFTDELNCQTTYFYDQWGRVYSTQFPDGEVTTAVVKSYAPNSAEERITEIKVNNASQGTQKFDGLGRLTSSSSGGRTTQFTYQPGIQVPSTILTADGKTINYDYLPKLNNVVEKIQVDQIEQAFTYHPITAAVRTITEKDSNTRTLEYTKSGFLKKEKFKSQDGQEKISQYPDYSLCGVPLKYSDISNSEQALTYNNHGQLKEINDPNISVTISYDEFDRIVSWAVTDKSNQNSVLTTTLTLDDFNREVKRVISGADTLEIQQIYFENGMLKQRKTQRGDIILRDERFTYDNRKRLWGYHCSGSALPFDAYGKAITKQSFSYDTLSNIIKCKTHFDGQEDIAEFHYKNDKDRTQLTKVTHTHADYPQTIALEYDPAGRLIKDEAGRVLKYDALGRLIKVGGGGTPGGHYQYDGLNTLVAQASAQGETKELYYQGSALVNEAIRGTNHSTRYLRVGETCVAQHRSGTSEETSLVATDAKNSILLACQGNNKQDYVYSPYGYRQPKTTDKVTLGYNGERLDLVSGTSHLGNGYRAYNPVLMRFNTPDSWSPFGAGGINPYAYCEGDPINGSDPSGHLSWQSWVGIGLSVVGLIAAVATAGMAIAAAGGLIAALQSASAVSLVLGGIGIAADIASIASGALESMNPEASAILGWVSLGLSVPGMMAGIGGLARGIAKRVNAVRTRGLTSLPESLGARKLGERFYLYQGAERKTRLVVTAHGLSAFGKTDIPHVSRRSLLNYFSPHGKTLVDPGLSDIATFNKVISFEQVGRVAKKTPRYLLDKYHSDYPQRIAYSVSNGATDVLTVRNRSKLLYGVTTNDDLFRALEEAGLQYDTIDMSHCRTNLWNWFDEGYTPLKVLEPGDVGY